MFGFVINSNIWPNPNIAIAVLSMKRVVVLLILLVDFVSC
jgi:hypothetical protein